MTSWYHAQASAKKWGGAPEDYLEVHRFIDGSKASHPDVRHRAMLHNAWGIFMVERVFGPTIAVGRKQIPTRIIAEQHIIEDLGYIPTMTDWLSQMQIKPWMSGAKKRTEMTIEAFTAGASKP